MGRTEFLTETDCERALVGRAKAKASTRAKWRSSSSACRRVLEKCLTPPTLLETGIFRQPFEHLTELQRPSAPIVACPSEARLGDFAYLCNLAGMQSRFG